MAIDLNFLKAANLSLEQIEFIKAAKTDKTADINQSRIAAELFLAKRIEEGVDRVVSSNENLSKSNEKNAKRMLLLTIALVIATIAQPIISYYSLKESRHQAIRAQTIVFASELLQQLRAVQKVYLNPNHFSTIDLWMAEVRRENYDLDRSFGAAMIFMSKKAGNAFRKFADIQVEFMQSANTIIDKNLILAPSVRAKYSKRFYESEVELAEILRQELGVNEVVGASGL